LYIPEDWIEDRKRRAEAGIPEELEFQTKPEMALETGQPHLLLENEKHLKVAILRHKTFPIIFQIMVSCVKVISFFQQICCKTPILRQK